jgi:hypothetical protein
MKIVFRTVTLAVFAAALPAQRPWQQITIPSVSEAAANFRTPPREYGAIHWAIWGDELTQERIVREFSQLADNGIYVVNLGPARGMTPKYLSPEHLALTRFAVEEARKRNMKIWLADEGSYPSGFAGGKISEQYPQLTMQGIVADTHISVAPGQAISVPVLPDTLGVLAVTLPRTFPGAQPQAGTAKVLPIGGGQVKWTAPPEGRSEVVFIRHVFRSSPTRYINRADGTYSKDSLYSLIDYLDPDATRAFLKTTHEVYKELFGQEFGKTVLGFFGDEPDYTGFIPWTPKLLDTFREQKGYDLQPYLPLFFAPNPTDEAKRAKADYYDVWSGIFRESFFGVQADWCARNSLEYLVHLNHEELMLNLSRPEDLIRNEGDFFRDMRHVLIPGIDNLNQLVPRAVIREDTTYDVNDNFPKLASSAAHLFGRPRVWSEEGGGTGVDGKFQLDYQYVRGVNMPQIRVPAIRAAGVAEPVPPQAAMLAWYTNRASYLMAIGRPAAQVALYHPAGSMWLGDEAADRSTTKLGKQLLEHQIDFDYFDEQSLASVAELDNGAFRNLSGQLYRAVVVPSSTAISRAGLERLRAMAAAGGKVIFVGTAPSLVVDKTFLDAREKPDLSFGIHEPAGDITASVVAALPKPDVALDSPCPALKYTHRTWRDADLYFFFNESDKPQSRTAEVFGHGQAQVWDAATGEIHLMTGAAAGKDSLRLPLALQPYEAKIVVIGAAPKTVGAPEPPLAGGESMMEFPLVDGPVIQYKQQVTLAFKPFGKRVYVECTDVHDYASLLVNGKDAGARAWQPYRWDITDLLIAGVNQIQIDVRTLPAGGRGGMGGAPPASGAPSAGGRGPGAAAQPAAGAPAAGGRGPAPPPPAPGISGAIRLIARDI